MSHSDSSAFQEVNKKVAQAGEILGLKPGVIATLSSCEREVVISIPLRREDDVEVLTGDRVQRRITSSFSMLVSSEAFTATPPFAPPKGTSIKAVFHVINDAKARTSSRSTS